MSSLESSSGVQMEGTPSIRAHNGNSKPDRLASKYKRKRDREPDAANKKRSTSNSLTGDTNPSHPSARTSDSAPADSFSANKSHNISDPETRTQTTPKSSEITTLPTFPLDSLKASLKGKFQLAELSVISSHKVEKRVSRVLQHLARFSWTDLSVLPGVVLSFAREKDIGKLVSVIELAKRRMHEDEQKWFQYNGLYHVEQPEHPPIIEETKMGGMDEEKDQTEEEGEKDDFEVMGSAATKHDDDRDMVMPDRFLDAVDPRPKADEQLFMAIFLTRVPVPELKAHPDFTMQTNERAIDFARAKRNGDI